MVSFPNFYWIYDRHLVVGWCRSFLLHANRSGSQTRLPPLAAGGTPSAAARLTAGCARALEMRPARRRRHPQGVPWNYVYNLGVAALNYETAEESQFSKNFARFINERNVEKLLNLFDEAARDIRGNGNAKIVLFDVAVKTAILIR